MTVKFALIGAGSRGLHAYAPYALSHPDKARIVAVAEPREWYRNQCRDIHALEPEYVFNDWRELLAQPKLADAVIIATQDADHLGPVLAASRLGYDILLEKPMSTNEADCRSIVKAVKDAGVLLGVCHVLRYTPYFRKIKQIIKSGTLGDIVTIRHFEQIGFWHFAHSYVRGNWRRMDQSSPMILAKACHDLDILCYLLDSNCVRLSSFGGLKHFTKASRPVNAAERCLDCKLSDCPYSASKFYFGRLKSGRTGWPLDIITADVTEAGILQALREGPYGRCVYDMDNDVADHQVVIMEFENGITATFTVTAFTNEESRRTEIYGSKAELRGDGTTIKVTPFVGTGSETYDFSSLEQGADSGHMGGDFGIMHEFIEAILNRQNMDSSAENSLASHLMAFAAERSRKTNAVQEIVLGF